MSEKLEKFNEIFLINNLDNKLLKILIHIIYPITGGPS